MENSAESLTAAIKKYRNIIILVKGSPDPDAIASSYALSAICHRVGTSSAIVMQQKLSLPENRAFVNLLKIPVSYTQPGMDIKKYDAFIVADYQSPSISEITGALPCAAYIDHHEPNEEKVTADFILRDTEAGATSSLLALLIKSLPLPIDRDLMVNVSTALLYGIYTDTDKYSHAGGLDYQAIEYLSQFVDNVLFHKISSIPLSKRTLQMLKSAVNHQIIYKDWLITGIGYVDSSHRDSIAIVADFLIKRGRYQAVVVFAAVEKDYRNGLTLEASFRSSSESVNLNGLIKKITPHGGARKYKGGYQIDLDYFSRCPDRKQLWEILESTTVELIKTNRDEMYLIELKGFYQKFKNKLKDYF